MADSRKIVKVFLASPGDLTEERTAAKAVVEEFNALFADDFGYQVDLIGWEDTVSVFGRPQAIINRELERCELFIGLMWKKWGTPPDTRGSYSSGFEEEFETSVRRRLGKGKPEISLLFKEIDSVFLGDPGEDLKKVLAFKARLVAEKNILFESFTDIRQFERKFRRCIANYLRHLRASDLDVAIGKSQEPTTGGEKQQPSETIRVKRDSPLSSEGADFLREFVAKTERGDENDIEAMEVARFRLLSGIIGRQGNDERSLGVHDANILFIDGRKVVLGRQEILGLITAGLRNYPRENVPLWHWLIRADGLTNSLLPLYSELFSDSERRAGALAAMRVIGEPIQETERSACLERWFAKNTPSEVRLAALGYLAEWGVPSDIQAIRAEFDRNDNQTVRAAAEALISISLRESAQKAIDVLYELQPTSMDQRLLEDVFSNGVKLNNAILERGIGHPNSEVRRIVVRLLRKKGALSNEAAEQLTKDDDVQVRYEALMALIDRGRGYSDAEAKGILISQNRNSFRGAFGFFGSIDSEAERHIDMFRNARLEALKDKELQESVTTDSMFDRRAEFVLLEREFASRGNELRVRVADKFSKTFSDDLEALIRLGSVSNETIEKAKSLEDSTRKQLTRQGLDIICRQFDPKDLELVRTTVRSGFVNYSPLQIEYLRKYGNVDDIPLIVEAVKRPEPGRHFSLLGSMVEDESKNRLAARAIYFLGRAKLARVLAVEMPASVLTHLVAEISNSVFRRLHPTVILPLLHSKSDSVRKVGALKCVRVLGKGRISKLLAAYVSSDEGYYYNVIHWLDFGASVPQERSVAAADRILNRMWLR